MIKRLSGGLILLCLTSISLGVTSGEVSITDPEVLEQLKELRNFIDVNRDFTKGFKNLKPVLVEYRSSASKFNGIALGNLSFNTDALHMSIGINTIQADGKMLVVTINVVYAWSDYIGYQVSSAKLTAYETLATGDGTFTGDVGVGGDLEVTGDASVGGDLEVTGDAVAKTLYQNNYNWESGDLTLNSAWLNGLTAQLSFVKFAQVNRELECIISLTLENETDESITTIPQSAVLSGAVSIPASIASKIYRKDGTNCHQNPLGNNDTIIPIEYLVIKNDNTNARKVAGNIYSSADYIGFGIHGTITIPAGESHFFDFRVSILL